MDRIDLTEPEIKYYETDMDAYNKAIPIIEIGNKYAKLTPISEDVFVTTVEDDEGYTYELHYNKRLNKCYCSGDEVTAEDINIFMKGKAVIRAK